MALGLAALFLLTDKPISIPHGTSMERFATMSVFVLGIGRCMSLGIFSNSLRQSLYAKSLALKEAYKRIEELAELDELTGSLNRRCIMRMLEEEISRAHRTNSSCSIALIDLDWFKRINDGYGHPTGDEVLRTFAITVFANIRSIDRFGRYGGEEFAVILRNTALVDAVRLANQIRQFVERKRLVKKSTGDILGTISISIGAAQLGPADTAISLIQRADHCLYAAKDAGRNCVISEAKARIGDDIAAA